MLHGDASLALLAIAHLPKTDIQAQLELRCNHGADRGSAESRRCLIVTADREVKAVNRRWGWLVESQQW